ncbi:MAG TPA: hypothetical protein VMU42_03270 [Candidatus Sulfotelmatobacter sp.]|nr:hypothetical protein [Candidatus Sulfotelmatobacter sp.]
MNDADYLLLTNAALCRWLAADRLCKMDEAEHCREEAARARRWVADSVDPHFREQLRVIAEGYEKLAARHDADRRSASFPR